MADHLYSNKASVAQLNAGISTSDTTIVLSAPTFSGFPAVPFWAIIARNTALAELIEVTSVAGATLTVVRAQGGTSASAHSTGDTFEHVAPAIVFQNSEAHISASTTVHGVTGSVVGTTGGQTIQDKTYRGAHRSLFSDALPAGVTASFESTADSAAARDGFVHHNTAGDSDRRGFLLDQAGTPRTEIFNDGTVKVTPNPAAVRKGIETTTSIKAGTTLEVVGTSTLTGNTTVGGTLGVTGATTAAAISAASVTASGTVAANAVTSTTSVSAASMAATGAITAHGSRVIVAVTSLASITSPATDQVAYLTTNNTFHKWSGTAWVEQSKRGAQLRNAGGPQAIPNNVFTPITFDIEDYDSLNGHSTVTNTSRYTATIEGWHRFSAAISFVFESTGARGSLWRKNGVDIDGSQLLFKPVDSPGLVTIIPARQIESYLSVSEYVEVCGYQNRSGGTTLDTSVAGSQQASMNVEYRGPN